MTQVHQLSAGDFEVTTIASDGPWNQNCYLVRERASGAFVVVDPGFDSPELRDSIREMGLPDNLLITHGHPDHLGAAAELSAWLSVECRVARADQRIVRQAPAYAAAFGGLRVRLPERINYIDPGDALQLGGTPVEVIVLPGHTPGSLAFNFGNVVLTGDTLFREHIGRTDFPGSDAAAITASVDRLLSNLAEDAHLLSGHGRPWKAGDARDWWFSAAANRITALGVQRP